MKFYGYQKCSTCRKALSFLKSKNISSEFVDITAQPPSQKELKAMLRSYDGNIKKLFNTSGLVYREMGLSKKINDLSDDDAIKLLAENGKLVKRPFIFIGESGLVGFKEEEWEEALKIQ